MNLTLGTRITTQTFLCHIAKENTLGMEHIPLTVPLLHTQPRTPLKLSHTQKHWANLISLVFKGDTSSLLPCPQSQPSIVRWTAPAQNGHNTLMPPDTRFKGAVCSVSAGRPFWYTAQLFPLGWSLGLPSKSSIRAEAAARLWHLHAKVFHDWTVVLNVGKHKAELLVEKP